MIKTKIPAQVKRNPANNKILGVSKAEMENNRYPVFIKGTALPHKAQQKIAVKINTLRRFQNVLCIRKRK